MLPHMSMAVRGRAPPPRTHSNRKLGGGSGTLDEVVSVWLVVATAFFSLTTAAAFPVGFFSLTTAAAFPFGFVPLSLTTAAAFPVGFVRVSLTILKCLCVSGAAVLSSSSSSSALRAACPSAFSSLSSPSSSVVFWSGTPVCLFSGVLFFDPFPSAFFSSSFFSFSELRFLQHFELDLVNRVGCILDAVFDQPRYHRWTRVHTLQDLFLCGCVP